jgi:hypothetical protein
MSNPDLKKVKGRFLEERTIDSTEADHIGKRVENREELDPRVENLSLDLNVRSCMLNVDIISEVSQNGI